MALQAVTSTPTHRERSPLTGRVGLSVLALVAAIASIVALAAWSGVTASGVMALLADAPLWLVPLVALLTAGQIALSAVKWRMVMSRVSPQADLGLGFAYQVSVASAFLSQVMTTYLSGIVSRSWAARRAHGLPLATGAGTSLFEQLFDVAVLAAMLVPTLIVFLTGGSPAQWLGLTAMSLALCAAAFLVIGRNVARLPAGDATGGLVSRVFAAFRTASTVGLFAPRILLSLFGLSTLRYLLILARVPVTVAALTLAIGLVEASQGFTVVQATQLASVTPGNLGIQELSWTGVLTLRGTPLELAAGFAIAIRIVTFLAMTLVASLSGAAWLLTNGTRT